MNQNGLLRLRRARQRRDRRAGSGLLEAVMAAFVREAAALDIDLPLTAAEQASRSRRVDPVSGDESLVCDWCGDLGEHSGTLVVNPDGSFYGEQEVCRRPPSDQGLLVHSIRAWGWNAGGEVCSEVRLLRLT